MKTSLLSLLFLTAVVAQDSCEDQNDVILDDTAVNTAWTAVEDAMLEAGGDQDNTGTQIILAYDFSAVADSNETKAYKEACEAAGGTVMTFEEDIVSSCTAETADHIPYEVHLTGYFKCAGMDCDAEDVPLDPAVGFSEKVVDERQNGISCELGAGESGASVVSSVAAFAVTSAAAMFALF